MKKVEIVVVNGKEIEVNDYIDFMYNEKNIGHCSQCPENRDCGNGPNGNVLPCGQYNCWVRLHCRRP